MRDTRKQRALKNESVHVFKLGSILFQSISIYFKYDKGFGSIIRIMVERCTLIRNQSDPIGPTMMVMSAIAGVVNYACLRLLQKLKQPDVNLRAATTFSFNDFISNGGILIAGALVLWLEANWPDLLVGMATALIAIKGGIEILRDARAETKTNAETAS